MKYGKMVHGRFVRKVNRFIAEVYINEEKEQVHIKNTGRLKELLQQGAEVLAEISKNPNRKTGYSLISVAKDGRWVNIDSQAPNAVAYEALKAGRMVEFGAVKAVKREVTFGESRFDLYFETENRKGVIEVKGVTLEENGIVMFPDAPTARGTKHVLELINAVQEGYIGVILFVVQMNGCCQFTPNRDMDSDFADALLEAERQGVQVIAYDTNVTEDEIHLNQALPIQLF
ncbi:DNA/RNA nuclease SfsA [Bacillus marasmi]|uniref:DNA/RNA nuclease SfsA n=1 Tax=Bacillus marasmi TaxID=1926279 RepID=UPI0011C7F65B|nr:DNA/RNA nuclease SfsA [Bacillus marasmi]